MQTVFETAGGNDVLRRLAYAWHKRAMNDVAAHTFSHGFQPSMSSDSPLIGVLGGRLRIFRFLW
jgi:hypothetical protein